MLNPANAYVAEFIAHMDALNVLRCGSLMTPVADLRREGGALLLDWSGRNRLVLDADGKPVEATVEPAPASIRRYDAKTDPAALAAGDICAAPAGLRMRTAIEIRHRTGRPVLMVEEGRLIGVIGDEEIYRGLVGRRSPSAAS